ncbi:MAG: hypothetical protein JRD49_01070 [Deltaproteobacteria bacterium]|nr:hypothetical protein [Deltaproteobacteria bacterium]MBW2676131.1 hypothetical protein [Deltaproteobacteria bacterium]
METLSEDKIHDLVNQYIKDRVDYINGPAFSEDYHQDIPYYSKCERHND